MPSLVHRRLGPPGADDERRAGWRRPGDQPPKPAVDRLGADPRPGYDTTSVHHAHTNSASLHSTNPGAASNWQFLMTGTSQFCVGHLAFRYHTLPNADALFLLRCVDNSVGGVGHDIQVRSNGQMRLAVGGVNSTSVGTVALDTWYILEWLCESVGTTHDMTWKVYPAGSPGSPIVAERTDSTVGQTDANFSECRVGQGSAALTTVDWYLDDWLLSETQADYPLGESIVKLYTPSGKGTHVDNGASVFQNFAGAAVTNASPQNTHLDLDEIPAGTTDGVKQVLNDSLAYLEYTMTSSSETSPPLAVRLISGFYPSAVTANSSDIVLHEGVSDTPTMRFDASTLANSSEWHASLYQSKPSGARGRAPHCRARGRASDTARA